MPEYPYDPVDPKLEAKPNYEPGKDIPEPELRDKMKELTKERNTILTEKELNINLDLTFREFRNANVARCVQVFHNLGDWSTADWAVAVTGEWGEACNNIKKLRRLDTADKDEDNPNRRYELLVMIAEELADARTYLDLLEASLQIDPVYTLVNKFNEVSDKRGSNIKL